MASTLLLDNLAWDLVLDTSGNIAVAEAPYALAQDAASAMRLFEGELFYDTAKGVPFWASILGNAPPLALIKARLIQAALTVPGVVAAVCFITGFKNRQVTGQVQIYDSNKTLIATAGF